MFGFALKKASQLLALLVGFAGIASADAPLPPPKSYEICSPARTACAGVDPKLGTTVYREAEEGKRYVLWTMAGWFRDLRVSDDGVHIVTDLTVETCCR